MGQKQQLLAVGSALQVHLRKPLLLQRAALAVVVAVVVAVVLAKAEKASAQR